MNLPFFRNMLVFISLLLVQALVFNQIHLWGVATPMIYVYLLLPMPRQTPRWQLLLWAFFMGLSVDIFSNTIGAAAASLTFVAMIRPYILEMFVQRESDADLVPTLKSLRKLRYSLYSLSLIWLYCLLFFTLETFTFFNWTHWITSVMGSTLLTWIFVLTLDNLRKN